MPLTGIKINFTKSSLEHLKQARARDASTSYSSVVRHALKVYAALLMQKQQGFSEVVVRRPDNGAEKVLLVE